MTDDISSTNKDKLRAAVRAAWDEAMAFTQVEAQFPDPRLFPQDVPSTLHQIIISTLDDLSRQTRIRGLIDRLPTELLAKVADPLKVADRINMALVSKAWHTAVFSTPALWTHITCWTSSDSTETMVNMLRLSAQADLDLRITLSAANEHVALPALRSAIHRCTRLNIDIQDNTCIYSLLELPAPRLRTLIIRDLRSGRRRLTSEGIGLLGGQIQNLKLVSLTGDIEDLLPAEAEAFASVKAVAVSPVVMDISRLERLLKVTPAVKYLKIDLGFLSELSLGVGTHALALPASVQSLDLSSSDSAASGLNALLLLQRLQWKHILRSRLFLGDVNLPEEHLFNFFHGWAKAPGGLQTAWIGWWEQTTRIDRGHGVVFTDGDNHRLAVRTHRGHGPPVPQAERSLYGDLRQRLPDSLFANVTQLYLHELVFDPESFTYDVPAFPQVVDLKVILMDHFVLSRDLGISPFLNLPDEVIGNRRVHFPSLQTLSLVADLEEGDLLVPFQQRVTPGMVCHFVKTHLQYDAERLRSILFIGVQVLVPIPEEYEQMLQLADGFDCDDRFTVWPVNLDAIRVFEPLYT